MNLSCLFGHSWVENGNYKYVVKQSERSYINLELYKIVESCSCCDKYKLSGIIHTKSNLGDVLFDKNTDVPYTLFDSSIDSKNLVFGYKFLKIYNKDLEIGDLKRV